MYIGDKHNNRILVVDLNFLTPNSSIDFVRGSGSEKFHEPCDTFITNTSLYVTDLGNKRVVKLSLNDSHAITVHSSSELPSPHYLYVDVNNNIYVSDTWANKVLLFRQNSTIGEIVAGSGVSGSNDTQLNYPYGIFVNRAGTIYVADYRNHRIMKWFANTSSGSRTAGDGTSGTKSTQFNHPTQVIIDTNEYMYISEDGNARITRWAPNSTFGMCIAGCTGASGTGSAQLTRLHSLAFDSNGSLYVSDFQNHRVQKFQILDHRGKYYVL